MLAATAAAGTETPAFRILGQANFCDATVMEGPNPRGASSAAPQGRQMILIDRGVLADLPYLHPFVMAHECAHHALGHTTPEGLLREGYVFRKKELDADCWAARTLAEDGQLAIVYDQMNLFRSQPTESPGPRYPTWQDRIDRMASCIVNFGPGPAARN